VSIYPPLTETQLQFLRNHVGSLNVMLSRVEVTMQNLILPSRPGDEDTLTLQVSDVRLALSKLDIDLFRTHNLVHRMKTENVPTSLPPPRSPPRERPTVDTLGDFL